MLNEKLECHLARPHALSHVVLETSFESAWGLWEREIL